MEKFSRITLVVWGICFLGKAQEFPQNTPDYIQSTFFEVNGQIDPFPILNPGEKAILHFDDLRAQEADYFYSLRYFNHDWQPSQLFENEYLRGIAQGRVTDFGNAVNTLQPFTHYRLAIPNNETQPLLSGNYLLEIEDINGTVVFSKPFAIAQGSGEISGGVYRSVDLEKFQSHQRLQLSLRSNQGTFRQPEERLHVYVMQNKRWDKCQGPVPIQFNRGSQIDFKLEKSLEFAGEHEFTFLDTKDLRIPGPQTAFVDREDLYIAHLHPDPFEAQMPYSWRADLNGRYQIQNIQDYGDVHQIADYGWVHFTYSAPAPNKTDTIYVLGHFNGFLPSPSYELYYNPQTAAYETYIQLKQGIYNYQYYLLNSQEKRELIPLGGNHAQTENEYTVLVYYRAFGALHDALVATQTFNSFNLLN